MIYSGHYRPYGFKLMNRVQAFNDYTLTLCVILTTLFTDYVLDQQLKYTIGWFFIGVVATNILVNYSIILPKSAI